jgi:hypothetical protein
MSLFTRLLKTSSGSLKHSSSVNIFPKDVWPIAGIIGVAITMCAGTGVYIASKPSAKWSKSSQIGNQSPFKENYQRESSLRKTTDDFSDSLRKTTDDLSDRFKNGFYR